MDTKRTCEEKAQSKAKKTKTIEREIHDACMENDTGKVLKLVHYSVRFRNLEIVREILKFASDCLDEKTIKGNTALHFAVEDNDIEIVAEILKNEADVNIENEDGLTAFQLALNTKLNNSRKIARLIAKTACSQPKITDAIYSLKEFCTLENCNYYEIRNTYVKFKIGGNFYEFKCRRKGLPLLAISVQVMVSLSDSTTTIAGFGPENA